MINYKYYIKTTRYLISYLIYYFYITLNFLLLKVNFAFDCSIISAGRAGEGEQIKSSLRLTRRIKRRVYIMEMKAMQMALKSIADRDPTDGDQ